MPIIERVEKDLFRFAGVCRHMVCPVSTEYHATGGLIGAFIEQDDKIKDVYRTLCDDTKLVIGKPVCERSSRILLWDTIFFPMKTYADDTAKYKDVRRNIEKLREFLLLPEHQHSVVGIPMLGCEGGGPDPYQRVRDMMDLFLDPIKATIFLSMSPAKVKTEPKYLVVLGPKGIASTDEGKQRVHRGITACLDKWGMTLSDFDGVVSGSETTLDKYIVGAPGGEGAETCYAKKHGAKKIIPVAINWEEDKTLAITRHRMVVTEIGTHFILIMPQGMNNNRGVYVSAYIREANEKLEQLGRTPKQVRVIGKFSPDLKDESPLNIE